MTTFVFKLEVVGEVLDWAILKNLPIDWPKPVTEEHDSGHKDHEGNPVILYEYKAKVIITDDQLAVQFKLTWADYIIETIKE